MKITTIHFCDKFFIFKTFNKNLKMYQKCGDCIYTARLYKK